MNKVNVFLTARRPRREDCATLDNIVREKFEFGDNSAGCRIIVSTQLEANTFSKNEPIERKTFFDLTKCIGKIASRGQPYSLRKVRFLASPTHRIGTSHIKLQTKKYTIYLESTAIFARFGCTSILLNEVSNNIVARRRRRAEPRL